MPAGYNMYQATKIRLLEFKSKKFWWSHFFQNCYKKCIDISEKQQNQPQP